MSSNDQKRAVIDLAKSAGEKIMAIYEQDFDVDYKDDSSPLTQADLASHHCIVDGLCERFPHIPILSEESSDKEKLNRMSWQTYWLIDPLDGTKEFVKRNGEFTVNIALVTRHQPVFGVVYAPALDVTYWGDKSSGAFKAEGGIDKAITVRPRSAKSSDWVVVGSRSHQSDEFKAFMQNYADADIVSLGSSLKLCLVAEGKADLYPRLGLTSEWDTAASQAVVEAAGGQVLAFPEMKPLVCNQSADSLLNPHFLVCASPL
ncbi:3'(2'),5'-bisphosphate nucleotidase CysQ [Litoricola sp.]|nr:3'(2'),5'-bisphosphate nucleotidase CysQ [Litorivicinus sp.]